MQGIFLTSFDELPNEEKQVSEIVKNFSQFKLNIENSLSDNIYESDIAIILIFRKIGNLEAQFEKLNSSIKNLYIFFKSGDIHIDEANSEILKRVELKKRLKEYKNIISFKSNEILDSKIKEILTISKPQEATPTQKFAKINNFILESSKGEKYYNANNKLEEVAQKLSTDEPISIVSLKGIGGVGKSTLAIEYATNALKSREFDYVVWLGIEEGLYSRLKSFVIEYLLKDDDGKQSDKFYESKLKEFISENPKTLIILDNYSQNVTGEVESFTKEFKSSIIITSRQKIKSITTKEIDVDTLNIDSSLQMFEKNSNRNFNDIEKESIKEIAKLLGGLPLALEISAKFLENYIEIEPKEYLEELKAKGLRVFDGLSEDELPKLHKKNLRATLQINEKHLQNEKVDLSLLKLFSLLAPEPLSKELIVEYIAKELEISSFEIKKSLGDLEKYSYIKYKDNSYSMHRLLQEAIRDEYIKDEKKLITAVAVAFMKWSIDKSDEGKFGKFFDIAFLHCEHLLSFSEEFEEAKVYLFTLISSYLLEKSKNISSLENITKAMNLIEKVEIKQNIKHVIFMQYAIILKNNGKYIEAIENNLKALEIVDKNNLKDISTIYNNLGTVYDNLKEYNKEIEYLEKALKIDLSIFGENHQSVATTYNNLGGVYDDLKNYEKAIEYYQKALNIALNIEYKHTAGIYNNLGLVYDDLKKYDKAIDYYQKALKINLKTLGKNHFTTAIRYNNLGFSYFYKRDYFQSFKYFYEAIKIRLNLELTSLNKLEIKDIMNTLIYDIRPHLTRSNQQEKQAVNRMINEINRLIKEKKIKTNQINNKLKRL